MVYIVDQSISDHSAKTASKKLQKLNFEAFLKVQKYAFSHFDKNLEFL